MRESCLGVVLGNGIRAQLGRTYAMADLNEHNAEKAMGTAAASGSKLPKNINETRHEFVLIFTRRSLRQKFGIITNDMDAGGKQ